MKIIWLSCLATLLFLFFSTNAFARSGCCSYHGGVCGCGCCDGTSLSSTCAPYYPECGGGYVYQPPPSCPLMSSYNSITEQCECFSGYVASGNQCISQTQSCSSQYGFNSIYDYLQDGCVCKSGYVWNSSKTSCISGQQACWNEYGFNSEFSYLNNNCECSYGYVFNNSNSACISRDQYCKNNYGIMSNYDLLQDSCDCISGYHLENNNCTRDVYEEDIEYIVPTTTLKTVYPTPKPKPTVEISKTPQLSPTPSPILIHDNILSQPKKSFWDSLIDVLESLFS